MVKPTIADRRKAKRANRILSIQYRLVKSGPEEQERKWYLSTTHDMSISGLSFLSEVPFRVDDVLEIHVVMSGVLDIFKGFGEVVRIERKETGAYFLIALKLKDNKPGDLKRPAVKKTTATKRNRTP